MAVNRSILPDGTLGYRAGTEGKTYKRVQDARIQDKKMAPKKKDQSVKSVCPVCNKQKCICASVKPAEPKYSDFKKKAFIDPTAAVALGASQQVAPMSALDMQRLRALQLAQEQRRIQHMKSLTGPGAATTLTRLRYANVLPILTTMVGGAGIGAAAGAGLHDDPGTGAGFGAAIGGGVGLLASILANGIGSAAGSLTDMSKDELKRRLQGLSASDYLVPGRGAYLSAQLFKDFEENEQNKPQQMVF